QGLTRAMYAMGYYYEMGIGCDKDVTRAKEWYEKAAADGSEEAKERLRNGVFGGTAESTAALRRHVTQKRQKAAKSSRRGGKKLGGLLTKDKHKDANCIVM
ncbi:Chitin synthase 4, partial [Coemansia sp. RSA 1285]